MAAVPQEDKTWWNEWWSPNRTRGDRRPKSPVASAYIDGGWRPLPLEGDPSVEIFNDSTARYVVHPTGMSMQLVSCEPMGEPHVSLHQNHYSASSTPGALLGSVRFGSRDCITGSLSAFADGVWSTSSRPTGMALRVAPPGGVTARNPAITMRADGRVAVGGGPAALTNPLVSLGVYRRGVFEMPSVDKHQDLLAVSPDEPFVNGAMVYARDLDRVLISQRGTWHAVLTTPLSSVVPTVREEVQPPSTSQERSGAMRPVVRQMGAPRRDGRPAVFGPRMPIL